jgi:hypothetical protein
MIPLRDVTPSPRRLPKRNRCIPLALVMRHCGRAIRAAQVSGAMSGAIHAHVLSGRSSETTITAEPSKELCLFCQAYEAAACKGGERTQFVLQLKHTGSFTFLISELARSLSSSWQYTVHLLSAPRYRSAQSSCCSTDQLRSSATRSAASYAVRTCSASRRHSSSCLRAASLNFAMSFLRPPAFKHAEQA